MSPARSASAWSMWLAPATIACTNVRTFRPGRDPPTRPAMRTVASTKQPIPSRAASVATTADSPALATSPSSSKLTASRSGTCDTGLTKVPPWRERKIGLVTVILPCRRGTFRGWSTFWPSTHDPIGGTRLTAPRVASPVRGRAGRSPSTPSTASSRSTRYRAGSCVLVRGSELVRGHRTVSEQVCHPEFGGHRGPGKHGYPRSSAAPRRPRARSGPVASSCLDLELCSSERGSWSFGLLVSEASSPPEGGTPAVVLSWRNRSSMPVLAQWRTPWPWPLTWTKWNCSTRTLFPSGPD